MSVLPFLIFFPLVAAILVLCGLPARRTSLWASGATLALALAELAYYRGTPYRFEVMSISPALKLSFLLGADGLSLMMALLTALVTLSAVWVTPKIENGENGFYACLLFIAAGAMGAFLSFDLFFFYAFHELALIPTFLLIGIWGHGENRVAAAWKITIYLAAGSFILLLGLLALYLSVPAGLRTFNIFELQHLVNGPLGPEGSVAVQTKIFPFVLIGFGILISLFPFHTWAPPAYAAAPTPAAMLHAGVLKKFGLYGLLRIAVPLLPLGMQSWMNWLLIMLVGNIIYVGLVTISQKRLDLMLGYSSVMHMGYIFLGIFTLNVIGLTGASLMMFAHGLSIAALFAVTGEVRSRAGALSFDKLGGLAKPMPFLAFIFGLAMFASIGLPGFANFASELSVFFGAFIGDTNGGAHFFGPRAGNDTAPGVHLDRFQWATICALWGVVMSAVYMLRAYRRVFLGEPVAGLAAASLPVGTDVGNHAPHAPLVDLYDSRRWALGLLIAGLVIVGFQPNLLVRLLVPAVADVLPKAKDKLPPGDETAAASVSVTP